jgi:alkane 1-monooxygenase
MTTTVLNPSRSDSAAYHDRKRYAWLLSVVAPLGAPAGPVLYLQTGQAMWLWVFLAFFYVGIPALDRLFGEDRSNPPESAVPALEADNYYRYITWAVVPMLWISFIFNVGFLATHELPWYLTLAVIIGTGNILGFGLNLGHELGHKKTWIDRKLALLTLALGGYGHFSVEHNRGHHRHVATPEDPASSRMGESIWRFVFREMPGAYFRAWDLEAERLERAGKSEWSLENEILQAGLITAALYGTLVMVFGAGILPLLLAIAFWGAFQLTSANYIEHYGLVRQKLANGRYEQTQPHHSWNSNHIASNLALFHLQRHSDHHAHPTRSYQSLRDFPELPTLPVGYFGMFLLAYVPPLWFRVMNPRLIAAVKGDVARINFEPVRRNRLVKQYGLVERVQDTATVA